MTDNTKTEAETPPIDLDLQGLRISGPDADGIEWLIANGGNKHGMVNLTNMMPTVREAIIAAVRAAAEREGRSSAILTSETKAVVRDVLTERVRQMKAEGWTAEHDDQHSDGALAQAAACYAVGSKLETRRPAADAGAWERSRKMLWPWSAEWWKPTDRRRDLVKAAALIVAEIERLDRVRKALEQP